MRVPLSGMPSVYEAKNTEDSPNMSWTINQGAGFSSDHSGGANVALGDASVRFLTNKVDPEVLKQLANRHDSKPAADWNQ
jgi:prepilin-type processing-associated H-X9-DG protein